MLCGLENMYSCAGRPPNSRIRTLHDSQTSGARIEVYFTYVYICIYMRMYVYLYNNYRYIRFCKCIIM